MQFGLSPSEPVFKVSSSGTPTVNHSSVQILECVNLVQPRDPTLSIGDTVGETSLVVSSKVMRLFTRLPTSVRLIHTKYIDPDLYLLIDWVI